MKNKTKVIALLGVCAAAAMMLSYVESFIPSFAPGVKIGLPNIVIVYLLYKVGAAKAAGVSMVRVLLTALLFGSVMSLLVGKIFDSTQGIVVTVGRLKDDGRPQVLYKAALPGNTEF